MIKFLLGLCTQTQENYTYMGYQQSLNVYPFCILICFLWTRLMALIM